MTTVSLRFGTFNAPESYKKGLDRDKVRRARRVLDVFTTKRIDIAAVQESGTFLEGRDPETKRVKALWAQFNDFVKGRQIGNGVLVNPRRWKSRLLEDIPVGAGDDTIHIAVVQITERARLRRRASWTQKFYAVHKPTRRAVNADLRPVVDATLREHTKRDDKAGMPWVVAGDFNGPFDHGVELGDHHVDSIRGSRHFIPMGQTVVDRPLLSDHAFLIADAVVEV